MCLKVGVTVMLDDQKPGTYSFHREDSLLQEWLDEWDLAVM